MSKKLSLLTPRNIFVGVVAILGIMALILIYPDGTPMPPIRSDGVGYYLYLPATFLYHDLSLQSIAVDQFGGSIPIWTGAELWGETGRYLIKYPIGEAVMMMPFFLVALGLSSIGGSDLNAFSPAFQISAVLSALFYTTASLAVLYTVLKEHFEDRIILPVMVGITFGTNLFHYATFEATFSHAYSFFLVSCFLYLLQRIYRHNETGRGWFATLGAVAGLLLITRPSNVVIFIVGLLYGITSGEDIHHRIAFWRERIVPLLWAGAGFLAVISIQMAYWKTITGSFVVYSYSEERFDFLHPSILPVLFNLEYGLLFWTPLVIATVPGLVALRKAVPEYFFASIAFLSLNLYVISSWHEWEFGFGFGHRAFIESLPVAAISICALYESAKATIWRTMLTGFIILCTLFTFWLMINYWLIHVPHQEQMLLWKIFGPVFFFN